MFYHHANLPNSQPLQPGRPRSVAQTALAALNKESNPFSVYIYTPAVKGVGEETTRTALRVCEGRGIGMLTTEDEMREVFGKRTSK